MWVAYSHERLAGLLGWQNKCRLQIPRSRWVVELRRHSEDEIFLERGTWNVEVSNTWSRTIQRSHNWLHLRKFYDFKGMEGIYIYIYEAWKLPSLLIHDDCFCGPSGQYILHTKTPHFPLIQKSSTLQDLKEEEQHRILLCHLEVDLIFAQEKNMH